MTRPLKVLIPNYRGVDSFTDNVADALEVMGHEVRTMARPTFRDRGRLRRVVHDGLSMAWPGRPSANAVWALRAARDWRPDLVLCLTLALDENILSALRDICPTRIVAWWGDPPANMKGMGLLADGYDRIYIKDAAGAAKLRAVDLPADLLHEAMNPKWHRIIPPGQGDDRDALIVAGNYYGYRQFLVSRLIGKEVPVALYGSPPPRWSRSEIKQKFRGCYIVRDEKSRIFGAGMACLNSTSMWEGDSLNCRAFEICGAGGLQLIENKPSVPDCFEPGREVLTYNGVNEILDHLARARAEPDWAAAIREAGHRRAHAHHTYAQRLERILEETGLSDARNRKHAQ
ncbi:hypothetical protein ROJ8625_00271 [Roseivivax jejudonensis]|uniref:Spore protein YkvP/CgeB glycosyl transferase-like domain-containing protein n=1 Tax=Roseivivax jejudonensis TaxID=1529041 RepID=A0A1X6Y661_9RHOB|nr:glycosyltransferase [Roseivivax jejudonensis]SLN11550.1 hypothetical protein ROJ8625_00271 [Roseivivax jejudonensis]